ncbi:MAG: hypothetical protein AAF533_14820 [Acidobacteriota bacterium]
MKAGGREYFEAIEEHFIRRRGQALMLSPADVHRVSGWHDAGIGLEAVLEAIDIHFERMARRDRPSRRAVTLAYLEDDVLDVWAGVRQRRMGASSTGTAGGPGESEPIAGPATHRRFVDRLQDDQRRLSAGDEREVAAATLVAKLAKRLEGHAEKFRPDLPDHDEQAAEDCLRRIEKSLRDGLRKLTSDDRLEALEQEGLATLGEKADAMKESTRQRLVKQLVDKTLREEMGLPRLSLFYV